MQDQSGTMVVRQCRLLCYEDVLGHLNVKGCPSAASPLLLCPPRSLLPRKWATASPHRVELSIRALFSLTSTVEPHKHISTGMHTHSGTLYILLCLRMLMWVKRVRGRARKQGWWGLLDNHVAASRESHQPCVSGSQPASGAIVSF